MFISLLQFEGQFCAESAL